MLINVHDQQTKKQKR